MGCLMQGQDRFALTGKVSARVTNSLEPMATILRLLAEFAPGAGIVQPLTQAVSQRIAKFDR
jgi:hypothetical protein